MNKKYNESIHFHKKYEFYLSPGEFLDMVWVYRNEIKPHLMTSEMKEKQPDNLEQFLMEIRAGILNGDLTQHDFQEEEWAFFIRCSKKIFMPFEQSNDDSIRKPDLLKILSARNSFADLLQLCKGKLPEITSDLVNGNIKFSLKDNELF